MQRRVLLVTTVAGVAAGLATHALAQCGSTQTVALTDVYDAWPDPVAPLVQPPGSAWTFRVSTIDGTQMPGGNLSGGIYRAWLSPGQPYNVPCVGPVFSPTQPQYASRTPSMRGVQAHPGNTAGFDNWIVFQPSRDVTIIDLSVPAEVLGGISDGVIITVGLRRASGADTVLVPATLVPYTPSGHSLLVPTAGLLPLGMTAADRLWVRVNMNANPFEDWANINPTITVRDGPVLILPPVDTSVCPSSVARLSVAPGGSGPFTYRWRREASPGVFADVTNGPSLGGGTVAGATSAIMTITPAGGPDAGRYQCVVTNACGAALTAGPVTLDVPACSACPADFDGSGGTPDASDIDAFFTAWLAGDGCADTDCSGGTPDATDIDRFFSLWLAGGC